MGRDEPSGVKEHAQRRDDTGDAAATVASSDVQEVTTLPADKPWIIWDGG